MEEIKKQHGASVALKVDPPLPCSTQDCPNLATVATASYDLVENGWWIYPLCRDCVERTMRKYEQSPN